MPQLDIYSILNQLSWTAPVFFVFYFISSFVFIPSLFTVMYARGVFVESLSRELSSLVASVFLANAYISACVDILASEIESTLDFIIYSKAVSSAVYNHYFEFEFSQALDEDDKEPSVLIR